MRDAEHGVVSVRVDGLAVGARLLGFDLDLAAHRLAAEPPPHRHANVGGAHVFKGVDRDRPLAGLRIPVARQALAHGVRPVIGLPDKVHGISPAGFPLALAERIHVVVEVPPAEDPAVRVVNRHVPARDACAVEEFFPFGLLEQRADLAHVGQPSMVGAHPHVRAHPAYRHVVHALPVGRFGPLVGGLFGPGIAELDGRDGAV